MFWGVDSLYGYPKINLSYGGLSLLNVLDLQGAPLKEFPSEVVSLFLLKYLSLRYTKVDAIPNSIGNLQNLETLDLEAFPCHRIALGKARYSIAYGVGEAQSPKEKRTRSLTCNLCPLLPPLLQRLYLTGTSREAAKVDIFSTFLGQIRRGECSFGIQHLLELKVLDFVDMLDDFIKRLRPNEGGGGDYPKIRNIPEVYCTHRINGNSGGLLGGKFQKKVKSLPGQTLP
ncbi:hypothetical protein OIU78_014040 [Salix suchowensis]|nr:hypothetical protein OIU78_014040 [Salix suchowensis]